MTTFMNTFPLHYLPFSPQVDPGSLDITLGTPLLSGGGGSGGGAAMADGVLSVIVWTDNRTTKSQTGEWSVG